MVRNTNNGIGQTLQRIVILLFSLAGLAERASSAPASRRRRALAFIAHGEAAAWGLLAEELPDYGPRPAPDMDIGCSGAGGEADGDDSVSHAASTLLSEQIYTDESPEAAMLLAARLRLLGWMIAHLALIIETGDAPPHHQFGRQFLRSAHGVALPVHAAWPASRAYVDTS